MRVRSSSRMRGAIDAFGDAQDNECQLQQNSSDEDPHEERHDADDEVDQPLRRRLLITEHDAGHDGYSAEHDGDNVKQLHDPAGELMMERKIEKTCKEILFIKHVASR